LSFTQINVEAQLFVSHEDVMRSQNDCYIDVSTDHKKYTK
jgi:hypothetical protein